MQDPSQENRLKRVEFKLNLVIGLCLFQTLLLAMIITATAVSKMTYYLTLITLLLVIGGGAYIFRSQIPSWFGSASRMFFASLLTPKSDSQKKDG